MFRNWSIDKLIIVSTTLVVLAEVVINFITSYQHIYDLGLRYGEYGTDARLMPVGIDLALLAFAEVNLYLSRRSYTGPGRTWMRVFLAVGVLGTVFANAAYGASWGRTGASLAFWSPLMLFATVEAGMLLLRVAAEDKDKGPSALPSGPSRAIPDEPAPPWEPAPEMTPAPEGKAPSLPSLDTQAWQGLSGIGLRNGTK